MTKGASSRRWDCEAASCEAKFIQAATYIERSNAVKTWFKRRRYQITAIKKITAGKKCWGGGGRAPGGGETFSGTPGKPRGTRNGGKKTLGKSPANFDFGGGVHGRERAT